jgi:hypothetical protein
MQITTNTTTTTRTAQSVNRLASGLEHRCSVHGNSRKFSSFSIQIKLSSPGSKVAEA